MSRNRGSGWYLLGILALIAVVVAAVLFAALHHSSRTDACRAQGGTVVVDVDHTTRTVTGRNGKPSKKPVTTTEHECMVNGQEVDEW